MAAMMPMIATTISSSMSVKPLLSTNSHWVSLPELKDVVLDVVGRSIDDAAVDWAAPVVQLKSNPCTSAAQRATMTADKSLRSKGFS